jgi:hypothetical protein
MHLQSVASPSTHPIVVHQYLACCRHKCCVELLEHASPWPAHFPAPQPPIFTCAPLADNPLKLHATHQSTVLLAATHLHTFHAQDPTDRSYILADETLQALTGGEKRFKGFSFSKFTKQHFKGYADA